MKEIISIIATSLVFVAYAPYIKDVVAGKTRPHIYSWLVASIVTFVLFALQLSEGAGWGALVTFSAASVSLVIVLLGLKQGVKDITKLDTVFFVTALFSIVLWLVADQPEIAATLLVVGELLGFAPTVRKSWSKPDEETLSSWLINGFRHGLGFFGLNTINYVTAVFPVVWAFANIGFSIMLILRRRSMSQ